MRKKEIQKLKKQIEDLRYLVLNKINSYERLTINAIAELKEEIENNKEKDHFKNNNLVIISNGGITRVYENGEEISKGIESIHFFPGTLPMIQYSKTVSMGDKNE